jgi:phage/plasmid-associated DNA primase
MSKDAVVTAPCQRAPSKNAPTDYLFELIGKRVAVMDETNENERVDLGLFLSISGGRRAKARPLYGKNIKFVISHTPFVQTNYAPELRAGEVKANIRRRLRVIPCPNEYVSPEHSDPTNSTHRRLDLGLKARMLEQETREQCLAWLARGSCAWYGSFVGLGNASDAVIASTIEYLVEVDKLQCFFDAHCNVDLEAIMRQCNLLAAFQVFCGERVSGEDLVRRMATKGYERKKDNGQHKQFYYQGLECVYAA